MDGVQEAPSPVIFPAIAVPLASLTWTSVSLPSVAPTLRAPLVSTDFAPSFGVMETTASDCLVSVADESPFSALASPDPESPRRRR